ncbi:MAG: ABC transporter permease [Treponema sp.]|jgi:ribose transport system permease protein|nr:ABC transporter permease [Treponema sp.]
MRLKLRDLTKYRPFFCFVGLIFLALLAAILIPDFRSLNNIITIFRQASILVVLGTGLTAVLLTGSMDLSIGAAAGLVGCVCAQLLKTGLNIPTVLLAAVGIGILIGLFNGFLIGIIKLPSFIATYGTNWVLSGLSIIVMHGAIIYNLPEGFTWFATGYIGPVPVIVIIALIIVSIAYFLLQRTTFGRDVYSYGSGSEAALYAGVPVTKTLILSFIFCSVSAGLAGLLMTARLNAADVAMSDSYGLQPVAAVVIGGTSMLGGEGGVAGTIIGALLLTIIVNVMNLMEVSTYAQPMVFGFVILFMVIFDAITRNKSLSSIK